ncbi:hypothetical protein Tco_1034854 [Tanacetum coccineum]
MLTFASSSARFAYRISYEDGDKPKKPMDKEPLLDLEKPMDTPMEFNKLRTRTTRKVSTRDTLTRMWQAFGQVQSKAKSIRVEPEVFGTTEEHSILIPPNEPMLLFTGGWLDSSILEWFTMSLRNSTAEIGHPEFKYMAPRLIEERRCRKESTELKNYLMEMIDHNDDKMYLAPYYARQH